MSRKQLIKLVILVAAAIVAVVLVVVDTFVVPDNPPSPLMTPASAQRALAVFVICMALWLTSYIPLAVTGLLAIALIPILGVMPRREAFALFGNSAVFFLLGVFLLAAAMMATGLSKRLTLVLLQRFDRTPGSLVVGVVVSAAFLALWMPEHAVAAMMFPIVAEVADALRLPKSGSVYGKVLFLGLAWGATIGGVGTFLGGARAPVALELLHDADPERNVSFLAWMLAAAPIVVIMAAIAVFWLRRQMTDDVKDVRAVTRMLDERVKHLGPMTSGERRLAVLGLLTVAAWVLIGKLVGLEIVALVSACSLFLLKIAPWQQVQGYVNWGILLMYGGAVALANALTQTGAVQWLADNFVGPDVPKLVIMALLPVVAILLTECISNTAAVAVILPIAYSVCAPLEIDMLFVTLAVTIPAGLAFSLPISSPPNAISFSSGYYGVHQAVRLGVPMSIASLMVVWLVMLLYWPLIGPLIGLKM
ncbi:MAG: DASS family sodium-coupled anion symporter [Planctomycetes bacterium]|nr:DASS family sodium-coupled anion symporter [Planctomycetota bacterium]